MKLGEFIQKETEKDVTYLNETLRPLNVIASEFLYEISSCNRYNWFFQQHTPVKIHSTIIQTYLSIVGLIRVWSLKQTNYRYNFVEYNGSICVVDVSKNVTGIAYFSKTKSIPLKHVYFVDTLQWSEPPDIHKLDIRVPSVLPRRNSFGIDLTYCGICPFTESCSQI